ncbi:hypothetical protein BT96DRAFT_144539 [Gymnopus androsaceus JB14]|uniref:Uncharacterized protein n=1 Tax=Gymnopus androsaceus JB14 TaxID=1447944 RepID=A0A6A4HE16_9AGAR|nr:hypothetical protein BT96DRAFT_144539 [Gymnopus androsaceus JB14]
MILFKVDVALDVIGLGLPKPYVLIKKEGQLQPASFAQSSSADWLWKFIQTYRNEFEALSFHQSALGASWWETLPDLSGTVASLSAAGRFSFRLFAVVLGQAALKSTIGKSDLDKIFEKYYGPLPDAPTINAAASSGGNIAAKPEDLDEKYASVPAAAIKLSSQLTGITDNIETMMTAELSKVFPNGNPNGTTLATDVRLICVYHLWINRPDVNATLSSLLSPKLPHLLYGLP